MILISKDYVNLYKEPQQEEEYLGLTILLKTCIDHEMGCWFATCMDLFILLKKHYNDAALSAREEEQKHTPKKLEAVIQSLSNLCNSLLKKLKY